MTMDELDVDAVLQNLVDSLDDDVLDPDIVSDDEVDAEIREAGGDPAALVAEGRALVKELLARRHQARAKAEHPVQSLGAVDEGEDDAARGLGDWGDWRLGYKAGVESERELQRVLRRLPPEKLVAAAAIIASVRENGQRSRTVVAANTIGSGAHVTVDPESLADAWAVVIGDCIDSVYLSQNMAMTVARGHQRDRMDVEVMPLARYRQQAIDAEEKICQLTMECDRLLNKVAHLTVEVANLKEERMTSSEDRTGAEVAVPTRGARLGPVLTVSRKAQSPQDIGDFDEAKTIKLTDYQKGLFIEALVLSELRARGPSLGDEVVNQVERLCAEIAACTKGFGFVAWLGTTIWGAFESYSDGGLLSHSGRRPTSAHEWRLATLQIEPTGEHYLETILQQLPLLRELFAAMRSK